MSDHPFSAAFDRLGRLEVISEADRRALEALPFHLETIGTNVQFLREGRPSEECALLIDGYACRHKYSNCGARQILSFQIAGDFLNLQNLLLDTIDHNLQTLTRATIGWLPMNALRSLIEERPALSRAFWRDTLIEAATAREWVLNVGQRSAKSRIAHILCEVAFRQRAAGHPDAQRFAFPFTQEEIGDAIGVTSVHVNRVLRELRDERALERTSRKLEILDLERLQEIAAFRADYLHLPKIVGCERSAHRPGPQARRTS